MTTGCIYKFRLGRDATGAYVGEMVDDWGWVIALRAEVVERNGVKVFEGTGTLTNTPGYSATAEAPA
ncbi:MAG: hypothetical protein ACRYF2_04960 [Janthinobacterium lividum]